MHATDTAAWNRMTVLSLAPDLDAIRPLTMVISSSSISAMRPGR